MTKTGSRPLTGINSNILNLLLYLCAEVSVPSRG